MREERVNKFNALKNLVQNRNIKTNKADILNLKDFEEPLNFKKTKKNEIIFIQENTNYALKNIENPLALIFGSAKKPGGGVLSGAKAQEEDVSLSTTWYFNVKDCNEYYKIKHEDLLYSENCLYVKEAFYLMDDHGFEDNLKKISLIGCAAPNLKEMSSKNPLTKEEIMNIYNVLKTRIKSILVLAEKEKHPNIILGAWGCGVFGLNPLIVSSIFKEVTDNTIYSGTIIFAIPDAYNYGIFKALFGDF